MTSRVLALVLSFGVGVGALVVPAATGADPFRGRSMVENRQVPHPFRPPGFQPHLSRLRERRFAAISVFATPFVVYAPPAFYGASPFDFTPTAIDPPMPPRLPAAYAPPPVAGPLPAPAPPPPPTPQVIEYPSGRYELWGDGMAIPFRWVWIPTPPPPPSLPPETPTPAAPAVSSAPTLPRHPKLYHWTDEDGVEHWTDREDAVPDGIRAPAKSPRLS